MDRLPDELLCTIAEYLQPIYVIAYKCVCQRLRRFIKPINIRALIEAELAMPWLLPAMIRAGGALTGGFLLGVLFGQPYGDIDILFIGATDHTIITTELDHMISKFRSIMHKNGGNIYHNIANVKITNIVKSDTTIKVRTHTINNGRGEEKFIDTIYIDRDIQSHVADYDLDFCKIYFDGALHMLDPVAIVKKHSREFLPSEYKIYDDYSENARRVECRRDKYIARGYTIG